MASKYGQWLMRGASIEILLSLAMGCGAGWAEEVAVLDREIAVFTAQEERVDLALGRLQGLQPDLILCVERAIPPSALTSDGWHITASRIESGTVATILDAVTAGMTPGRYRWYESPVRKGVIHILSVDAESRFPCLDTVLSHFVVENVNLFEALESLSEAAGIRFGLAFTGARPEGLSLDLANVTVRDALTHLVLAAGKGMGWSVSGVAPEAPIFSFGRMGGGVRPEAPCASPGCPPAVSGPGILERLSAEDRVEFARRSEISAAIQRAGGYWADFKGDEATMALITRAEKGDDVAEWIAAYEEAMALHPDSPANAAIEFRVADIYQYIQRGDWVPDREEALRRYEAIVSKYDNTRPEVLRSHRWLALLHVQKKDYPKAREHLQALLDMAERIESRPADFPELTVLWSEFLNLDTRRLFDSAIQQQVYGQ